MKKFTAWLVKKAITNYKRISDLQVRSRYGYLEGGVSIVGNSILFLIKITAGIMTKSIALIADAVHTLSDCATSIVIIIGFKMAKKPSDKEHPFGHGRIESVAALIVAVLLFVAGIELLRKSVHSIINPSAAAAPLRIIFLIAGTIIVKELMARFAFVLGDMIDSQAIKADAVHHRTDAITTVLVVVALIASRFGFVQFDGIAGVLVSLLIFYSAYDVGKEAVSPLLGEPPSKETLKAIEELAKKHKGVFGVHDIIYNKYGQTNIISLHIEVSDKETAIKLHDLSESIEDEIIEKMGGMAIIHVDPINREHPQYDLISRAINNIIHEDGRISSFHELRIVGTKQDKCNVVFDISLEQDVDEQGIHDIIRSIKEKFKVKFPEMKLVVKVEPKYVYNL